MEKELTRLMTLVPQTVIISLAWDIGGLPVFSDKISISLIFDNLLDTSYRNYLKDCGFTQMKWEEMYYRLNTSLII